MAGRSYADAIAAASGGVAPAKVVCVLCVLSLCVCCVCLRACVSIDIHTLCIHTYVCMYASHT
jgi:hypothetical protein